MSSFLSDLTIDDSFSSNSNDLLNEFYIPCLEKSTFYQRAAGYFNSGLLALAPLAFADFLERGGKIQLICSPKLNLNDFNSISEGRSLLEIGREKAYQDILEINQSDNLGHSLSRSLSSLIASRILELKILLPTNKQGLFHDKLGIFSDGKNFVSFIGSANETAAAWLHEINHENFEVFRSWSYEADARRIRRHRTDFEILWNAPRGWKFATEEEVKEIVFNVSEPEEPNVSLKRIKDILKSRTKKTNTPEHQIKILQDHQNIALNNWYESNSKGIVSFATGGGKTLTAISAIRDWRQKNKSTLILVPSTLLHKQWQIELRQEILGVEIISFGAGNPLKGSESFIKEASENSNAVILATYSTAGKSNFLNSLSKNENLLIIADEVHTAGRKSFRDFMETDFRGPRMGLSATAERYGDSEGTKRIFEFFGKVLEPIFTIPDAIKAGRLVPYSYDFVNAALDSEEIERWEVLTKRISQMIAIGGVQKNLSDLVKRLLIERSKIVKKCEAKNSIPKMIIQQNYELGDRWLVYCSDQAQMSSVKESLMTTPYRILDFHQNMIGAKDETLEIFSRDGGIMLAIKCLDEGVDIPQINKAVILASSSNPREYIQRRGRVLRKTENKYSAKIWDILVTKLDGKLISVSEAVRALEFAKTSTNLVSTMLLEQLIKSSNMESTLMQIEMETDDED